MTSPKNKLAAELKTFREKNGWSQQQACDEFNKSQGVDWIQGKWSRIELGYTKPFNELDKIAAFMCKSQDHLFHLLNTDTQETSQELEELLPKINDIHAMLYELLSMAAPPSADMIGAAIKMQRENYGHSLQDVSHQTGLPASLIKRMEEGVAGYGANIPDIAAYLEMKTSDIELLLNIETQEYKKMFAERMRKNVEERGKTGADYQQPSIENFRKMVSDVTESMEKSKTQKTEKEVNGNV